MGSSGAALYLQNQPMWVPSIDLQRCTKKCPRQSSQRVDTDRLVCVDCAVGDICEYYGFGVCVYEGAEEYEEFGYGSILVYECDF